MIYLDNAATTFPKPEVVYSEMDRINRSLAVNAGRGAYTAAKNAADLIEETRTLLLNLFHAEGLGDIVFTPSVTHAFNQMLYGLSLKPNDVVYISPYEHNAVARPLQLLSQKIGFSYEILPLREDFSIDIEKTEYLFSINSPNMVILNAISNVTGYRLPFESIFELSKRKNISCINVLDASQAAGLIDINVAKTDIDILGFAGHKTLYGPFGIAGFFAKKHIDLSIVLAGGTGSDSLNLNMPKNAPGKYEAASPNIVAIAGLRASLKSLNVEEHYVHVRTITEYFLEQLHDFSNIDVLGIVDQNLVMGIVSLSVEGYSADEVGSILNDEYDIAVRTGFHCAPFIHEYIGSIATGGSVRVGIGQFTTKEDIDLLIEALESL